MRWIWICGDEGKEETGCGGDGEEGAPVDVDDGGQLMWMLFRGR